MSRSKKYTVCLKEHEIDELRKLVSYAQEHERVIPEAVGGVSHFIAEAIKEKMAKIKARTNVDFSKVQISVRHGRPAQTAFPAPKAA